ncbi:hypothetical protein BJ875DRAFT_202550 [Amylocarpus encephaloides]|uniref:Uncharacterized protein n=1 Tax=Amylocarpus encephaloides TaxID=45428 RepID=A0A9P8C0Z0_9HELO|nr:hypothetical protein BJ875DRAFT_202550 [Amylocarpus encephaloides]
MLSSQLAISSQSSIHMRSPVVPVVKLLRSSGHSHRSRGQQIRNFRFGPWSSYLDPTLQKELRHRHRHRTTRQKYIEAINGKLAWDAQSKQAKLVGLKGFMCGPARRQSPTWGGRWDKFEGNKKAKDDLGGNIEDIEQNALDPLLHTGGDTNPYILAESAFLSHTRRRRGFMFAEQDNDIASQTRPWPTARPKERDGRSSQAAKDQSIKVPAPEYFIDPITNRKVFRNHTAKSRDSTPQGTPVSVKTFKNYGSQFDDLQPPGQNATKDMPKHDISEKPSSTPSAMKPASDMPRRLTIPKAAENPDESEKNGLDSYDAKASYDKPFMAYEPVGKYAVQDTPDPTDQWLKAYETQSVQEKHPVTRQKSPSADQASQNSKRFDDYMLTGYDDKASYGKPYMAYEPDGKVPAAEIGDPVQKGLEDYDNRHSYRPIPYNKSPEEGQMTYAQMFQDKNGDQSSDPVQKGLHRYDSRVCYNAAKSDHEKRYQMLFSGISEEDQHHSVMRPQGVSHSAYLKHALSSVQEPPRHEKLTRRRELEEDYVQNQVSRERFDSCVDRFKKRQLARDKRPPENPTHQPTVRKLTNNFSRDLPHGSKVIWAIDNSETGSLTPETQAQGVKHSERQAERKVQQEEKEYIEGLASRDLFSRKPETPRLQTSLDRQTSAVKSGRKSKVAWNDDPVLQGEGDISASISPNNSSVACSGTPQTSRRFPAESENRDYQELYEETYGTIGSHHRQPISSSNAKALDIDEEGTASAKSPLSKLPKEPTMYKILAYDSTMQSVSVAETTSIVNDPSAVLTVAEVLLRLSNPSKFFPHFGPLQSQGYEIVSGSGDVLVFRKVREAAPAAAKGALQTTGQHTRSSTNPIDGMQCSPVAATGNFASPTGFVNHDLPTPEPAFKSNIDVRREEPAFSGKSHWDDEAPRQKRKGGRGKRLLLTGVWVAACSYAVGVVTEFIKTGGVDGIGPQGF